LAKKVQSEEWISQAEAARIRGISQAAILGLIRRERLKKTFKIGGKTFVDRAEVEAFVAMPIGRPRKKVAGAGSLKLGSPKKS
jgi:hypothetical protein